MMASGEFDHDAGAYCASGRCAHAVSERVPCRCERCDPHTAEMVAQYAREAMMTTAEGSQTTPRFKDRTFDRFIRSTDNEFAYAAAKRVASEPSRGLGLFGMPGVGKSHLAAAIVNECAGNGILAVYVGIDELLSRIKATFDSKTGETESRLIREFAKAPVLALDDLGKESLTDWTVRTLYSLNNRRYEQNLPLIVTSNFSSQEYELRKVGKDAEPMTYATTCDRIFEMTGKWIEISGGSHR